MAAAVEPGDLTSRLLAAISSLLLLLPTHLLSLLHIHKIQTSLPYFFYYFDLTPVQLSCENKNGTDTIPNELVSFLLRSCIIQSASYHLFLRLHFTALLNSVVE